MHIKIDVYKIYKLKAATSSNSFSLDSKVVRAGRCRGITDPPNNVKLSFLREHFGIIWLLIINNGVSEN